MTAIRVLVLIAGATLVLWTLASAVQTVVVPRATTSKLTRLHFLALRRVFHVLASPRRSFASRDRVMAMYAPLALITLPGVWVVVVIAGFTAIFWGTGIDPISEAMITSGSSLLTLGFVRATGSPRVVLEFVEAALGLGIVSLMISYLPTIYGSFSRREVLVGMLEARAGLPPSPAELLTRYTRIGRLDRIAQDLFQPWESWFTELEESHTSQPALVFFRSPHPERSWITAAGCMLDTAAIVASSLRVEQHSEADLLLRTGFFSLRRIADSFEIPYDPDPRPSDPISISRREFDLLCIELIAVGVPVRDDRDRAWRDFAGWRVNYDEVLVQLCALVMAPAARWSSDRIPTPTRRVRSRPGPSSPWSPPGSGR